MRKQRLSWCLLAIALCATPAAARQVPTQQDSILIQLRQLLRRVDSLEHLVANLRAAGADTAGPIDELAALRAAARAAAGTGTTRADTTVSQVSRTGNLRVLNPEISVTGDVVGSYIAPGGASNSASWTPREFEFSFQSALDPYTRTKIFVTREEDFEIAGFPEEEGAEEEGGSFEIEEGYMYWVGLPGGFGAKIGKFRQEIGLYNRVVPEGELETVTAEWAQRLADGPARGISLTKRMLNLEASMSLGDAMQAEGWIQAECMKHPDYREAYEAFVEKRDKDFVKNSPGHGSRG